MGFRIRKCKVLVHNELGASARSSITKRRIEQILSARLKHYDLPEGRIHLRHLQLDIGDIDPDNFEAVFYHRLEVALDKLVQKLMQEYQTQQWLRKSAVSEDGRPDTRKRGGEEDLNRLMMLLEGMDAFPDREQLLRAYFERYLEKMPENSQLLLDQLLEGVHVDSPVTSGVSDAFESLDYLLDLLNEKTPGEDWMETILKQYKDRFGTGMPEHIRQTLFSVLGTENTARIPEEEKTSGSEKPAPLLDGISSEEKEMILEWLNRNVLAGNWMNRLGRAYEREFGRKIPEQTGKLLWNWAEQVEMENNQKASNFSAVAVADSISPFSGDTEDSSSRTENRDVQWAYLFYWLSTHAIEGNWQSALSTDFEAEFNATLPSEITALLHEVSLAHETTEVPEPSAWISTITEKLLILPQEEVVPEAVRYLAFLLHWLSTHTIEGNLQSVLSSDFEAEFNASLPSEIAALLQEVSLAQETTEVPEPSAWITAITEKLLTVPQEETTPEAVRHLAFLLHWLSTHTINGDWQSVLSADFEAEFNTTLSSEIAALLQEVSLAQETTKVPEPSAWITAITEKLLTVPQEETAPEYVRHLAFLLHWLSTHVLEGNWQSVLSSDFEAEFNASLPSEIAALLQEVSLAQETTEVPEPSAWITAITEKLLTVPQEETTPEAVRHLAFLLHWLSTHTINGDWQSVLSADFEAEFNTTLSSEIAALLQEVSLAQETIEASEPSALIAAITEKLLTVPQEETVPEAVRHLAFLLHWLSTHILEGNWQSVLSADFEAEFNATLPSEITALLQEVSLAQETTEVSEPSAWITAITEKLLTVPQEETAPEYVRHLAFLLHWLSTHVLEGNWQSVLSSDFEAEFNASLPSEIAALLQEVSLAQETTEVPEPSAWITAITEKLLTVPQEETAPEAAPHLAFLLHWLSTHAIEGNWQSVLSTDFEAEFKTSLPSEIETLFREMDLAHETTELPEPSAWITAITEKLLTVPQEEVVPEAVRHLAFLLHWLSTHTIEGNWQSALFADFEVEFNASLPSEIAALLQEVSLAQETTEVSEPSAWITAITEKLLTVPQEETAPEYVRHLAFLLHWLSTHVLEGNWQSVLSSDFEAEFNASLPSEIAALLQEVSLAQETTEVPEPSAWITAITEKLLILPQEETTPEAVRHLAFLLHWLSTHTINGDWQSVLSSDFEAEFNTTLPSEIEILLQEVSLAHETIEVPEPSAWITAITEKLLTVPQEEVVPEAVRHLAFLLHWLSTHILEGNWQSALSSDFEAEFNASLPSEIAALLQEVSLAQETTEVPEPSAWITAITEKLLIVPQEEVVPEAVRHLAFLLHWLSTHILEGNWQSVLSADFEAEFNTTLSSEIAALLQEVSLAQETTKVPEPSAWISTITEKLLILPQEEVVPEAVRYLAFLLHWLSTHTIEGNWQSALSADFEAEFNASLPSEIAALLQEVSLAQETTEVPEPSAWIAAITEKLLIVPQEEVVFSEAVRHLAFLLHWLSTHAIEGNWQSALFADFEAGFNASLPSEIAALLQEVSLAHETTKLPEPSAWITAITEKLLILPQEETTPESLRHFAFLLHWLSTHTIGGDWQSTLSADFEATFNTTFPSEITALLQKAGEGQLPEMQDKRRSNLMSSLLGLYTRKEESVSEIDYPTVTTAGKLYPVDEVIRILEVAAGQGEEESLWSAWISETSQTLKWPEWLKFLMLQYERTFGREMAPAAQLKFLELQASDQPVLPFGKTPFFREFERDLEKYVSPEELPADENRHEVPSLEDLRTLCGEQIFDAVWFDTVGKQYSERYGVQLPAALQSILFHTRRKFLLQEDNAQESILKEEDNDPLKKALLSHFGNPAFEEVREVLQQMTFGETAHWFNEFSTHFVARTNHSIPVFILKEFQRFTRKNPEWIAPELDAYSTGQVEEEIRRMYTEHHHEEGKISELGFMRFLEGALEHVSPVPTWRQDLEAHYFRQVGSKLPPVFHHSLEEIERQAMQEKSFGENSAGNLYARFVAFTASRGNDHSAGILAELMRNLEVKPNAPWFASVLNAYRERFGQVMPIEMQKVLLDFTAAAGRNEVIDYEGFGEELLTAMQHTVHRKLTKMEEDRVKQSELYLGELLTWMKQQWDHDVSWVSVKDDYERKFGHDVPKWVRNWLVEATRKLTPLPAMPEELQRPVITPRTRTRSAGGTVTDKAKVLKLKKQLEALKNKRETEAEIVQDAGIIVGWLFWKKQFDRFGWLQEGRFFLQGDRYTGTLAANWLTRLGTGAYGEQLHPLMTRVCDLTEEETLYLNDDELEESMSGINLADSLTTYYEGIMQIWSVFRVEELAEFKQLFIGREGVVVPTFMGWDMTIVEEHYDVLLGKSPIPWPITVIRFPWSGKTFNVEWKAQS